MIKRLWARWTLWRLDICPEHGTLLAYSIGAVAYCPACDEDSGRAKRELAAEAFRILKGDK